MSARFNFQLCGVGRIFGGGEAEVLWWDREEEAFDGVEGAVGKDIDGIYDVVEKRLMDG